MRTCANGRREDRALQDIVAKALDTASSQIRDAQIQEVEDRWWKTAPMPDVPDTLTLHFQDVSLAHAHKARHLVEVWPAEDVQCAPTEPFQHVFQRFRVQVNKKHRHPFLPTISFDALLGSDKLSFADSGRLSVAEILPKLSQPNVVPYVRNDEDDRRTQGDSPAYKIDVWKRTLPSWCTTPNHWIEPTPPPGFAQGKTPTTQSQYYIKVPTLLIPGNGRNILPTTTKPNIIARHFFLPVHDIYTTSTFSLQQEDDLVPFSGKLIPGALSLDQARAFLGRVVQCSTKPPRPSDAEPAGKRRKVNTCAAQTVGIAWGLETDAEGTPSKLHCFTAHARTHSDWVLHLSAPLSRRSAHKPAPRSPMMVREQWCEWVGLATLPADRRAVEEARVRTAVGGEDDEGEEKTDGALSFDQWYEKTKAWIATLNGENTVPIVQVGPDGAFVAGDLGLAKGADDEFEAHIDGAKPGVWRMFVEDRDAHVEGAGDEPQTLVLGRFDWAQEGSVDYDAMPASVAAGAQPTSDWEDVGSFSADAGLPCLFSKHALDALLACGTDWEAMLETFVDDEDEGFVFVPGGVVLRGDDGGYAIEGRRDEDGLLVEIRLVMKNV
ncbi:hypothetical protein OF83DRAFT_632999 [Amylostereum chailletii]|nr:hypothetical protein OF83DRAFT_632999 [Amylostereum chailletii]